MQALDAKSLSLSYVEDFVIQNLDLEIPKGKITVFIGGNGSGKSTLLRSFARLLKPKEGSIILDGEEIAKQPTKQIAKRLSILPQGLAAPEGLTVLQLVKQGRYPYQNWFNQWSVEDEEMVHSALEATNMLHLSEKPVTKRWIA